MLDFLLERSTVISLAIIGGVLSLTVAWCSPRKIFSDRITGLLNKAAYGFMAASMVFFILAGLIGNQG